MNAQSTPKITINSKPITTKTKLSSTNPGDNLHMSTPYSSSYDSTPNALITTSPFIFDSDSDDDLIELSFNPNISLSSLNNNIDSIPLINRITPPPPLFINNSNTSYDEYDEYDPYDSDNNNQFHTQLSISIPSLTPKNISNTITPITSNKNNGKGSHEKRFNWNIASNDKMYILNDYLTQHVNNLIDPNLSE